MIQLSIDVKDFSFYSPTKLTNLFLKGVLLENDDFEVTVDIKDSNGVTGTPRKVMNVRS